jgi:tetratricopeptide (TPR) repeat protein
MLVKYCNANCQKNHWPKHKIECKQRAAELRDEALFKDPPAKEDCPICFLPMPKVLVSCISLPPATILSVPIYDFVIENERLVDMGMEATEPMEKYYACCGKTICRGCDYSFDQSGNVRRCPFCNSDRDCKTIEQQVDELRRRVEANDPASICLLANSYHNGLNGFQEDHAKAIELYARAAELGSSQAHFFLGNICHEGGDLKKAKFHIQAAAVAGHEGARCNLGTTEYESGNIERAIKHFTIAASSGCSTAMHNLQFFYKRGWVSRESINSSLAAYNNSCVEMRSEARDAYINMCIDVGRRL